MKKYFIITLCLIFTTHAFSQGLINNGANIVITNSTYLYIDNGGYVNNPNGEIENDGTIKLTGDWINNNGSGVFTITNSTGEVEFIGNSLQEIGGSTVFENLTVNNTGGGVYISDNNRITYNLTLNAGDFDLRDYDIYLSPTYGQVLNEAGSRRIKSTDGVNDGQGTGEIYTYKDNPSGNVANLGLTIVDQIPGSNLRIVRGHRVQQGTGSFTSNSSVFRYYRIETPGSSAYPTKRVRWETIWTDELNGHNSNELIMYQWTQENSTGNQFWSPLPDNNSGQSVPIERSLRGGTIIDYVFITLGSETNPLPVELIDFTPYCNESSIKLIWHTSSENAADYFSLYRSYDAINFTFVASIPAAGYSNQELKYEYEDKPSHTPVYYKLTQTDYDGKTRELDIKSISCSNYSSEAFDFEILGNNNSTLSIKLKGKLGNEYELKIYDDLGRILYTKELIQNEAQERKMLNINLISAVYLVSLTNKSSGEVKTKKIIIAK